MTPLSKDEIRRRVQQDVFTRQWSLARLERESGLSQVTFKKALDGIIGETDQRRFTRYYQARDDGRIAKRFEENIDPHPQHINQDKLVRAINWTAARLRERGFNNKNLLLPYRVKQLSHTSQKMLFYQYDDKLKHLLLKEFAEKFPGRRVRFYDRWTSRKWIEAMKFSEEDRDGRRRNQKAGR